MAFFAPIFTGIGTALSAGAPAAAVTAATAGTAAATSAAATGVAAGVVGATAGVGGAAAGLSLTETLLLGASLAAGGLSAKATYDAGKISQAEYKLQAKAEGDAARGREIERKRALIHSLSSQHARTGAQGVAIQGSNAAIMNRDIKDNRQDLLYDTANTRTAQRILRSRGANASARGTLGAITSIADTALDVYQAAG